MKTLEPGAHEPADMSSYRKSPIYQHTKPDILKQGQDLENRAAKPNQNVLVCPWNRKPRQGTSYSMKSRVDRAGSGGGGGVSIG